LTAELSVLDDARFVAPSSDEEMFRLYWKRVRGLLVKQGVPPVHADDAAQDVFAALVRRKVREMYEPGHTVTHQNGTKRCTFQAFLLGVAARYARGIREKYATRAQRERFLFDLPDNPEWAELLAGFSTDAYPSEEGPDCYARMRAWLALQPPAQPGERDLLELFDELASEARKPGKKEKEIFSQLWAELEPIPDASLEISWNIGGLTVTPEQVHAAVLVLQADKSIMVLGPLQRAGHPLGDAPDKRWYHPFSKEEIKAHPELAIDPQTHRKPAGHVKIAVLHRLRRMLEEALPAGDGRVDQQDWTPAQAGSRGNHVNAEPALLMASPPQLEVLEFPEPSAWERIEAVLWELGATADVVDMCQAWAAEGGMAVPAGVPA